MTTCSTHVLDSVRGRPAAGIGVALHAVAHGNPANDHVVATAVTDDDGRVRFAVELDAGPHRLVLGTGAWFAAQGRDCFHPEVAVSFTATAGEHHHVALLLGPYSYTTYRGS